jgi:hypothetical protein
MPTFTPYFNLALYNNTSDSSETFASYRAAVNGTSNSNMIKIENAIFALQVALNNVPYGSFYVAAEASGANTYVALGITGLEVYTLGYTIVLNVDENNSSFIEVARTLKLEGLVLCEVFPLHEDNIVHFINQISVSTDEFSQVVSALAL